VVRRAASAAPPSGAGSAGGGAGRTSSVGSALVLLSLIELARAVGVSDRIARSVGGAVLVAWFTLPMGEWLVGDMTVDFSVFILAGVITVVGATWLILYNGEALHRATTRVVQHFPAIAPVAKMAMA